MSRDSLVQRESRRVIQQRVRQAQSSSENPLCKRVPPAVIDGRIACPSDGGGEPCHAVHLFKHKLDAELVEQSSRMCFPDCPMPLTDCVLLWSDGGCRHGFAPQVFELLSELNLEFSSLVVNQPSRHAKGSDPVFEEVVPHEQRMLAGNIMATTPKVLGRSRMLMKLYWLPSQSARTNRSMGAVSPNSLSVRSLAGKWGPGCC